MTTATGTSPGQDTQPDLGPDAAHDPRFPWKSKGTRKPLGFWDRIKFLLLFGVAFGLLVWNEFLRITPQGTWADATDAIARGQRWLLVLVAVEALRQVHFLLSEWSAGYNRFWSDRVFGRTTAAYERKFNPWNRYRISRVSKWLLFIFLVAMVLGQVTKSPPVVALFKAPAMMVAALPFLLQIVLFMFIMIMQFVAMFWFLSRGGVETYFPDDIERRFRDVWGQDHVLERVKENVILLENPESIEAKGGHVPSGILLWGPPGTGKTLMAEAVAGETGKPYVFVDPGAFTAMFMGIGILKVKSLFRKLRKLSLRYGGVIVFFDEADTLGSRGARNSGVPQPGGAMSPQFREHGCSGFEHLSLQTRWALDQHVRPEQPEPPAGWRNRFVMGAGMGGGSAGFDGTLQALLTELSGLKKPRGFLNRVVRRTLGMKPKPPPAYRILVMMASNLPEALDPALLRPGRIDRIYKVGYPSKAGRVRTYQGYFDKVTHDLTPEQIDKIATITPYATGASIKDLVNEALIYAIGENRDVVTWKDVIKAKHLKSLGPSEGVEYVEEERHATAVHEACHAVVAWKTRHHLEIDIATIEKGSTYLGMVSSIPPEERFTQWRSEYESDILVALASLAGERMFYGGDNSSGVSGDLHTATLLASLMESYWGMGAGVSALPALRDLGIGIGTPEDKPKRGGGSGIGFGSDLEPKKPESTGGALPQRIEQNLSRLLVDAERILAENRIRVLALAHALETQKTLTGEDVIAVLEGKVGPLLDGRPYSDPAFIAELETYHAAAVRAHQEHTSVDAQLPKVPRFTGDPGRVIAGHILPDPHGFQPAPEWVVAGTPHDNGSGNGSGNGSTASQPEPTSQPGPVQDAASEPDQDQPSS